MIYVHNVEIVVQFLPFSQTTFDLVLNMFDLE